MWFFLNIKNNYLESHSICFLCDVAFLRIFFIFADTWKKRNKKNIFVPSQKNKFWFLLYIYSVFKINNSYTGVLLLFAVYFIFKELVLLIPGKWDEFNQLSAINSL